jgi:signal transduction histidine kinase
MSLVLRRTKKTNLSANEILHEFQWYIILIALIFTSISFILDSLQQLSAFTWIAGKSYETQLIFIINNQFGVLLNILIIGIFAYLIYLLARNRIKVTHATLWYALLVCLNVAIPYLWIIENVNSIHAHMWRDIVLFTTLVFVVSTCTSGKYVYYVTVFAVILSITVSLLSENPFLHENLPLIVFILAAFSFALWKKDTLLQKIVLRQREEKQKIEELSLFKEKMNYMLFHDIKVPLNSIIKQANALSKESHSAQISLQAENVKRMLSNMIDIASSSDARLELSATGFNLSELLQKVSQKSLYSIYKKNIAIEYGNNDSDFELFGDKDLIERALINVIENAVKYSPGNGKISILTAVKNDWLTIRIQDQGPGIKEEEKDKIFLLFYTSDQNPNAKKSSGIGLAFCKLVAEAHGGTIVLISPEDGGSEFVFKLPIVKLKAASFTKVDREASKKYSEELRKSLSHLLPGLRQLDYFQTSEIYSLLSSVSFKASARKDEWEEIKKKALSCNPENYSDLINQLS